MSVVSAMTTTMDTISMFDAETLSVLDEIGVDDRSCVQRAGAAAAKDALDVLSGDIDNSLSFDGYAREVFTPRLNDIKTDKPEKKKVTCMIRAMTGLTDRIYRETKLDIGGFDAELKEELAKEGKTMQLHYVMDFLSKAVNESYRETFNQDRAPRFRAACPEMHKLPLPIRFLDLLDEADRIKFEGFRCVDVVRHEIIDPSTKKERPNPPASDKKPKALVPPFLNDTKLKDAAHAALRDPEIVRCVYDILQITHKYIEPEVFAVGDVVSFNTDAMGVEDKRMLSVTGLVACSSIQVKYDLRPVEQRYYMCRGKVAPGRMSTPPELCIEFAYARMDYSIVAEPLMLTIGEQAKLEINDPSAQRISLTMPFRPMRLLNKALSSESGSMTVINIEPPSFASDKAAQLQFESQLNFLPRDGKKGEEKPRLKTLATVYTWTDPVIKVAVVDGVRSLCVDLGTLFMSRVGVELYDLESLGIDKSSAQVWTTIAPRILPNLSGIAECNIDSAKSQTMTTKVAQAAENESVISQYKREFPSNVRDAQGGLFAFPLDTDANKKTAARAVEYLYQLKPVLGISARVRSAIWDSKDIIASSGIPITKENAKFIVEKQAAAGGSVSTSVSETVGYVRNMSTQFVGKTVLQRFSEIGPDWEFFYIGPLVSEHTDDMTPDGRRAQLDLDEGRSGTPEEYQRLFTPDYEAARKSQYDAFCRKNLTSQKLIDARVGVIKFTGAVFAVQGRMNEVQKETALKELYGEMWKANKQEGSVKMLRRIRDERLARLQKARTNRRAIEEAPSSVAVTEDGSDEDDVSRPKRKNPEPIVSEFDEEDEAALVAATMAAEENKKRKTDEVYEDDEEDYSAI